MTTYSYTGAVQDYVVPTGVQKVLIEAWGAQGSGSTPGQGGYAKGELAVTPGETLKVYVGGRSGGSAGGWNGGAAGGQGGGGGGSDVRRGGTALTDRKIVAGGGGGSGNLGYTGGAGGGTTGGTVHAQYGPFGGTQTAGGGGGTNGSAGSAGTFGAGGAGASSGSAGGGGGGGWYGGGGGSWISSWGEHYAGGGGSGYVGGVTNATLTAGGRTGHGQVVISVVNDPPNAPSLVEPVGAVVLDRAQVQRFSWTYSDPDGGSQASAELQYRLVGAPTWTTVSHPSATQHLDLAGGTLAAGDYEWQVRTTDPAGATGPWSSSAFFTSATQPNAPTITSPPNNATVPQSLSIQWTASAQTDYQLQVLDGGVVLEDNVVASAGTRAHPLTFPDNNVTRTIRLRVKASGLWSDWTTITVTVSYTRPATPVVTLTPVGLALQVAVVNPTPGAGEPAVVFNRVFVDDGLDDGETLRVAQLQLNGSWLYRLPRSGVDYDPLVRVVAVGDNGTESSS